MKLFKSSILALLACSAVAMVSCDGGKDAEYVTGAKSDGAYFATTAPMYTVEDDATSFTIPVDRPSKDSPSTVNLTVSDPSGLFGIPNTLTFEGDALSANIVVTYDAEKMGYDVKYPVSIQIEGANTYGNGDYSFTITRPAPWKTIGKGLYTDAIMCSLYNIEQLTYGVEIQESLVTPNLFRVKNPYRYDVFPYTEEGDMVSDDNYYMIVDCTHPDMVYVPEFSTNMIWDPSLGVMSFQSRAAMFLEQYDLETIAANGHCGKFKDGIVTMPSDKSGFVFKGTVSPYDSGWYGPLQKAGWRLVMPGVEITDYSANVNYEGRFTNVNEETFILAHVTLGDDVEYARVAAAVTKDVAAMQQAIVSGELESIEISESGDVRIPVEEGGIYTIMVVTFGKGEPQAVATTACEINIGGNGEWENLGEAAILDGWMLAVSSSYADEYDKYIWTCKIQRSTKREGIYRLIQPYGPESPMGKFAEEGIYNIEINAADPNDVYIEPQSTGNGWFSDGIMTIATKGYREDLPEDLRGTYNADEQLFWFPATTCLLTFNGEDWYRSSKDGAFQIIDDSSAASKKSFRAVKESQNVGSAKQRMNGVPYNPSHQIPRWVKFERVF